MFPTETLVKGSGLKKFYSEEIVNFIKNSNGLSKYVEFVDTSTGEISSYENR